MAALPRPVLRPFRHEGRHQAVLLRDHLGEGLEERCLVRGRQRHVIGNCGLHDAGTRFLVQSFDPDVHLAERIEQRAVEVAPRTVADHRIPEPARRHGRETSVILGANRLRRLAEDEELVLEPDVGLEPESAAALDHAAQQRARADRFGRRGELAEEEQSAVLEGQRPAGTPAGPVRAHPDSPCASP